MHRTYLIILFLIASLLQGVGTATANDIDDCQNIQNPEKMLTGCKRLLDQDYFDKKTDPNYVVAANNLLFSAASTGNAVVFKRYLQSIIWGVLEFRPHPWGIKRKTGKTTFGLIALSYFDYNQGVEEFYRNNGVFSRARKHAGGSIDSFDLNAEAYLLRSIDLRNWAKLRPTNLNTPADPARINDALQKAARDEYAANFLGADEFEYKFLKFYLGDGKREWIDFLSASEKARPAFLVAMQDFDFERMNPDGRKLFMMKRRVRDAQAITGDIFSNLNRDIAPAMRLLHQGHFDAVKVAMGEGNKTIPFLTALWLATAPSDEMRSLIHGASDAYKSLYEHGASLGMIAAYAVTKADTVGLCGDTSTIFSVSTTITTKYRNAYGSTAPDSVRTFDEGTLVVAEKFGSIVKRANMTKTPWRYVLGFEKFIKASGGCGSPLLAELEKNMRAFAASM